MSKAEVVNVIPKQRPADYHCTCKYCKKLIGELRPADGSYYSKNERREYYGALERGTPDKNKKSHIAKTPLHVARWAIQQYSEPGDWVLDPTIGAGTTAVEALTQGRNIAGLELQFGEVLQQNIQLQLDTHENVEAAVARGDARNI